MRFLFAKDVLGFPRAAGHDLRAFQMMRALRTLGHEVGLATVETPTDAALVGLPLDFKVTLSETAHGPLPPLVLSYLQSRFFSYWGIPTEHAQALDVAAREFHADVVVGMGVNILPHLAAAKGVVRVWYSGDEWVTHYASLVRIREPRTWRNIKEAAIWGVYERAFAPVLDRVWVVSERERRAMNRWGGVRHVDVLANGVDADYYAPQPSSVRPASAVFWGRLDFHPNLQALDWFCRHVWPALRQQFSQATFRIIGYAPGPEVEVYARMAGVILSPNVADLRPMIGESAVAVMPFQSGGGIKNKILEAASLAKPVISTPFARNGLRGEPPIVLAGRPDEWIAAVSRFWLDPALATELGRRARQWVLDEHSWSRTANEAVESLCLSD